MTANATTAEDCLAKLGIHLPHAPTPFGAIEKDPLPASLPIGKVDSSDTFPPTAQKIARFHCYSRRRDNCRNRSTLPQRQRNGWEAV
ncbi:MAG TPA: hypothetical protein VE988_26585 [Gemmataceae bacterium]|nr:hypothetical protein [Gemmataceae bacterium]